MLTSSAALAVALAGGFWLGGSEFLLPVAVTGAVMLVNLWLWKLVVARLIGATVNGAGAGAALGLFFLKFLVLSVCIIGLLMTFPALPVLLGSSVLVAAVLAFAVAGLRSDLQVGEG